MVRLIRNSEWNKLKNKTYDEVALRMGFGSMDRMILVLQFSDASSSSVDPRPFTLRCVSWVVMEVVGEERTCGRGSRSFRLGGVGVRGVGVLCHVPRASRNEIQRKTGFFGRCDLKCSITLSPVLFSPYVRLY